MDGGKNTNYQHADAFLGCCFFVEKPILKHGLFSFFVFLVVQVGGVVETNRPDTKNAQYQACIKQGDLLLNRVQKLGRVVDA